MEKENQKDPIDAVHLEIPFLIRLFEYAREDATGDKDLHVVAENLLKCSRECEGKPLSMECYDKVIPAKEESTVAGDVAGKDVSLFQGKDKPKVNRVKTPYSESRKILSVAEAVSAVLKQ